jgi:hypothetical protein
MYKSLRPAAQEPGVYGVVGVWVAAVGVEAAASVSALGAGTWLIAVDARVNDGHGAPLAVADSGVQRPGGWGP